MRTKLHPTSNSVCQMHSHRVLAVWLLNPQKITGKSPIAHEEHLTKIMSEKIKHILLLLIK